LIILAIVNCLGAYIAFFHSGVERHWFRYDSSCTGFVDNELSLEQMIKRIESTTTVACDVLGPQIFGFTMANWNALLLAFISCVTISLIFRKVVYKLP
jgi:disulfide bond formation protein DsbB